MKVILGIKLFDYDEVALMLGVRPSTIRKYIQEKELQTTTIDRKRYLNEAEIKKLIKPTKKK